MSCTVYMYLLDFFFFCYSVLSYKLKYVKSIPLAITQHLLFSSRICRHLGCKKTLMQRNWRSMKGMSVNGDQCNGPAARQLKVQAHREAKVNWKSFSCSAGGNWWAASWARHTYINIFEKRYVLVPSVMFRRASCRLRELNVFDASTSRMAGWITAWQLFLFIAEETHTESRHSKVHMCHVHFMRMRRSYHHPSVLYTWLISPAVSLMFGSMTYGWGVILMYRLIFFCYLRSPRSYIVRQRWWLQCHLHSLATFTISKTTGWNVVESNKGIIIV